MKRILNWFKNKTKPSLKIIRETKVDGSVLYFAYYNNICQKCFDTKREADEWVNKALLMIAMGYPTKEIIRNIDI